MKKIEDWLYVGVIVFFVIMMIMGAVTFSDGFKTGDSMLAVAGLGLMVAGWIMDWEIGYISYKSDMDKKMEQLQHRIDYLEDVICKEYSDKDGKDN